MRTLTDDEPREAAPQSDATVPTVSAKPEGAAAHLGEDERRAIWDAYIEALIATGRKPQFVQLAARFNRNRDTIAACIHTAEFETYKTTVFARVRREAKDTLSASVPEAASAMRRAIDIAADKGDIRAAERVLLYTGTVEPIGEDKGAGLTIVIGGQSHDVRVAVVSTVESQDQQASAVRERGTP